MADKMMLNFRCPAELLNAIDALGQERHPSNSAHGCDRSKTLLDIVRAGIEALSDGSVVLQASDNGTESVRRSKTENEIDIEARFVVIEELSESPAEPLRSDTEEIENLQSQLQSSDRLIIKKNQEVFELNARLVEANRKISERDEEIERLESELATRSPTQPETSATVGTDLSKVEAADLLNQLKARRKKSGANLADMEVVLEILGTDGSEI